MCFRNEVWRMINGETIKIRDMKTEHIKNSIKALEEDRIQINEPENILFAFNEELNFREYINKIIRGEL